MEGIKAEIAQPVTPWRNSHRRPSLPLEAPDASLQMGEETILVKKKKKKKAEALTQVPNYNKRNIYKLVFVPLPKIVKSIES